jgi:hypothetical protein
LVRLVLARKRDVDRESEFRHGRHGPLDRVQDLLVGVPAARVVQGDRDDQALALAGNRQPGPRRLLRASSAAGTTMCGMAANGGTGSWPSQKASRPAEVNAGTNSAPR